MIITDNHVDVYLVAILFFSQSHFYDSSKCDYPHSCRA